MDPAGAEHLKSNTTKVLKMDNSSNRIRVLVCRAGCAACCLLLVACCAQNRIRVLVCQAGCAACCLLLVACVLISYF